MMEESPVYLANLRSMQPQECAAQERLIEHAKRDTGQSQRVAQFLLAWWNASECGGFDLTHLWALDKDIAADIATVFGFIRTHNVYPDTLGYEDDFKAITQA